MQTLRLRFSPTAYLLIACAAILTVLPYREALSKFIDVWNLQPEYSHGILIPFLSGWLIWRQRAELRALPFTGSWVGMWLIGAGALLAVLGDLATIWWIVQYGFIFALYGVVLCLTGPKVFRKLWIPLLILVFMIPLPAFFNNTLSLQMQLLSSQIGVSIIRLAGISVFLEGNVIDLGTMQLQVAEACDGLRYLFPLMTLAFVMAYLFQATLTRRLVLFFSSIPIAILMNSFRIGAIGITVEYWGRRMAEGLLHDFEGWVVFMLSTAALVGVGALLKPKALALRDAFIAADSAPPAPQVPVRQALPRPFIGATVLVALAAAAHLALPARIEQSPSREAFTGFPLRLAGWHGQAGKLENVYLEQLQLDDYLMANYQRDAAGTVPLTFYVAWYASQRSGRSVHSPRACIPGGGWQIRSFEERELDLGGAGKLPVNRAVIELAGSKQVVYYWFEQRGRRLDNEYLVKWYIFWDALTRNRSDGALVRLSMPIHGADGEAEADRNVTQFAAAAVPMLSRYVPD